MFDRKQQVMLHAAAAAILMFLIAMIGGVTFGAALVWGLLCGGIMLQLRRQNVLVAEGRDVLHGTLNHAGTVAGVVVGSKTIGGESRPATLDTARNGQPDDLKQIDGVGPKIEQTLNGLGIYHFDQIAAWTAQEISWVDQNLEGFKGRVTRDDWVGQARALMAQDNTA